MNCERKKKIDLKRQLLEMRADDGR